MRKRLSYANVTATLALVFAMSGGAMAANSYLINSTKQINPKVLKKLTGKPGKNGIAGANGATGPAGATGPQGPKGTEGPKGGEGPKGNEGKEGAYPVTLPSGQSESGDYAVAGGSSTSGFMITGITFPTPLTAALGEAHAIWVEHGATNANCPGVGSANPGYLCVYETTGSNHDEIGGRVVDSSAGLGGANTSGFVLFLGVTGASAYSYGSWTVTAA